MSPYYPCPNLVKCLNKSVKRPYTIYCHDKQRKWDKHLSLLNVALNSVPHYATGGTPAMILLGRDVHHPLLSLWDVEVSGLVNQNTQHIEAYQSLLKFLKKVSEKYNEYRVRCDFKVHDLVVSRKVTLSKKA
ncbi:hypothetical protein PR048_023580 [Dryococelus australis]|uniref:Uncharacterized protein n=1 Tax=Dryococelus australis TaxID=614101 RepID=A0ABQ9GUI5_9NEOP|nr:hypothetical protein PR048_023580 [Dryococelus australis]